MDDARVDFLAWLEEVYRPLGAWIGWHPLVLFWAARGNDGQTLDDWWFGPSDFDMLRAAAITASS